ncbi:hypothetical protein DFH07DRAFT_1037325 [Mycena maculata]|uniref:Uncharacterized protein n=1 Tax=Mycena maculata TaxID=230809 RepID=A0AAD7INI8_9AGAR|nr:hypothetical protein DFH07DRAFT_1037325 [Mycena maculata]
MVAQPNLTLVNLVAIIVGTLFYGMYFIIFVISIYLLFESARGSGKYRPLFRSAVFMSGGALFIATTANWVATLLRIFSGFIYFQKGLGIYFEDNSQVTETISTVFLSLSVAIGDAMIALNTTVISKMLTEPGPASCIITIQATVRIATNAEVEIALNVGLTPVTVFTLLPDHMGNLEDHEQLHARGWYKFTGK